MLIEHNKENNRSIVGIIGILTVIHCLLQNEVDIVLFTSYLKDLWIIIEINNI